MNDSKYHGKARLGVVESRGDEANQHDVVRGHELDTTTLTAQTVVLVGSVQRRDRHVVGRAAELIDWQ